MRMEPESVLDRLAHRVIGAAIEVHRALGPGFLEAVFGEARCQELGLRGIRFRRQVVIPPTDKGHPVGSDRLDLLVEGRLVLELKAVAGPLPINKAVVISYLRATRKRLGLLINFNVPVLRAVLRRIILSRPALASLVAWPLIHP